ncbi:unnamed protein product [Arctia plantaginis]|uniref:Uncharacterized protein n=1 Tax=Arctia plantaginis TaxID=874455 RepID=A0A8S1B7K4_ARCPL|nr:unnamed protein product [Arctia plantaginis]
MWRDCAHRALYSTISDDKRAGVAGKRACAHGGNFPPPSSRGRPHCLQTHCDPDGPKPAHSTGSTHDLGSYTTLLLRDIHNIFNIDNEFTCLLLLSRWPDYEMETVIVASGIQNKSLQLMR